MKTTIVRSGPPDMDGLLVIQKGKIFIWAKYGPRCYKWDLSDATKKERKYLKKCILAGYWIV